MPRVLTVDDSKALRMMVRKHLRKFDLTIEEAENGEEGLKKLEGSSYDLVLLDVTMPVLDGPGMLKRMRENGDRTPVIMLTAESGTSIIGQAMKLGIDDYILKPFKPEEVSTKVAKALSLDTAPSPGGATASTGGRQSFDLLIIDDMQNVHNKLKTMLPDTISSESCTSGADGLQKSRENAYKVVLVDNTLPDLDTSSVVKQLKVLQGEAHIVMLAPRSDNLEQDAARMGFAGVLIKPFSHETVNIFLARFLSATAGGQLIAAQDDVVYLGINPEGEKPDRYFVKVKSMVRETFENVAAACYEAVYVDMTHMPQQPDRVVKLVIDMQKSAQELGMEMRLIGPDSVRTMMQQFTETSTLPFFDTLDEAKAAA